MCVGGEVVYVCVVIWGVGGLCVCGFVYVVCDYVWLCTDAEKSKGM